MTWTKVSDAEYEYRTSAKGSWMDATSVTTGTDAATKFTLEVTVQPDTEAMLQVRVKAKAPLPAGTPTDAVHIDRKSPTVIVAAPKEAKTNGDLEFTITFSEALSTDPGIARLR